MFVLAATVVLRCWGLVRPAALPTSTAGLQRGSGILLVVIAAFIALGLHLPGLVDAMRDRPSSAAYLDLPNTFWVVKFYDLGIVVPAALAIGVGLLRQQIWARKPAYGVLGGYTLIGWSVAGMAWTMLLNGDPDASIAPVVGFTGISVALTVFAYFLYRPLFEASDAVLLGSARYRLRPQARTAGTEV